MCGITRGGAEESRSPTTERATEKEEIDRVPASYRSVPMSDRDDPNVRSGCTRCRIGMIPMRHRTYRSAIGMVPMSDRDPPNRRLGASQYAASTARSSEARPPAVREQPAQLFADARRRLGGVADADRVRAEPRTGRVEPRDHHAHQRDELGVLQLTALAVHEHRCATAVLLAVDDEAKTRPGGRCGAWAPTDYQPSVRLEIRRISPACGFVVSRRPL